MPARFIDQRKRTSSDPLSDIERAQLDVIGPKYFGGKGAARLAGDDDDGDPMETRTLIECESWRIVDGDRHVYDAWYYMGDSGTIFKTGTTAVVAEVIQCGLQCANSSLRTQLGAAMVAAKLLPTSDLGYAEFSQALANQQRNSPGITQPRPTQKRAANKPAKRRPDKRAAKKTATKKSPKKPTKKRSKR